MTDDDLEALLHRADPAAGLASIAPDRATRLLEDTMSVDTETDIAPRTRVTAAIRRRPHRWLLAAAAAVLVLAGAGFVTFGPARRPADPAQSVTRLTADDAAGKCAPPTAARLATAQIAFEGTVRKIIDGVVTFTPTRFDAGRKTDTVEVRQTSGASEQLLGGSPFFEVGQTYLVAASDGQVLRCGYTGVATPELRALYDAAF